MMGFRDASGALTLLVLLTGAPFLCLSSPSQTNPPQNTSDPRRDAPPALLEDRQGADEERRPLDGGGAEEEEELFKDVDPKTLAAVLLEALNQSQVDRRREREEPAGGGGDVGAETEEATSEEEHREGRTEGGADRDRDGREELELLMAAQGKEQEEAERKKAQKEEEKITEKVTSRTMSQNIQLQPDLQPAAGGEKEQGATPQHYPEEEEEQLNPEELKNLETMMKEFPRLNTAVKREGKQSQREIRGSGFNDVIPLHKGSDMSRKKLRWQEETQKALSFPKFSGNIVDQLDGGSYAGRKAAQTTGEQEVVEDDGPEEDEEEEEEQQLNAEEEEALVKAEQEEMRRQVAEAQRARMKEEKLADVASDMLLRYIVKQSPGTKKDGSSPSSAAEDKRSEEKQEVTEDIDPQTIDKLIEISSKLHLPADDVVDIISDVEKKKKKDVPLEVSSHWQWPPANGLSAWQVPANQNSLPVLKRPPAAFGPFKARIQEAPAAKQQDLWSRLAKTLPLNQDPWLKAARAGAPVYRYPAPYQRRPLPQYQLLYFPPPPRPKPHYYIPKSAHALNRFVGYPVGDPYTSPLRAQYHSWVQPRLKKPPAGLQQKPFYTDYPLTLYPRTFQLIPKPRPPPQASAIAPQTQLYYSVSAPPVAMREGSYRAVKQPDRSRLEKYIQQMLTRRPQLKD